MALDEETPYNETAAEDQLEEAREQTFQGGSRFPGLSYEDGVVSALDWVLGNNDTIPYPAS